MGLKIKMSTLTTAVWYVQVLFKVIGIILQFGFLFSFKKIIYPNTKTFENIKEE